jgi:hypothetical protein
MARRFRPEDLEALTPTQAAEFVTQYRSVWYGLMGPFVDDEAVGRMADIVARSVETRALGARESPTPPGRPAITRDVEGEIYLSLAAEVWRSGKTPSYRRMAAVEGAPVAAETLRGWKRRLRLPAPADTQPPV